MRILYVANHNSGGNDDEGAITYSLLKLGHDVQRVRESVGRSAYKVNADFLLCHHWREIDCLEAVKIPKVCWCFDRISWPPYDGTRHVQREAWAARMAEACDLLFFTDGDHVAKDTTSKLRWLTQGADERAVYDKQANEFVFKQPTVEKSTDILFVGGLGYGRESFVQELCDRYGDRFKHIAKGCYGSSLADEVSRAKIVVAPDTPVTDRYWSNRVYNILRLGGFLLHPWSSGLYKQYDAPASIRMYRTRKELHDRIDMALGAEYLRNTYAGHGQLRTTNFHTYTHRCAELIKQVETIL